MVLFQPSNEVVYRDNTIHTFCIRLIYAHYHISSDERLNETLLQVIITDDTTRKKPRNTLFTGPSIMMSVLAVSVGKRKYSQFKQSVVTWYENGENKACKIHQYIC